MALLKRMPPISVNTAELKKFGKMWKKNGGRLKRTPPCSSMQLSKVFDAAIGKSLAVMLGGIPIRPPGASALGSPEEDCVEVGHVRVVGGVRPQNFDVGYRPDGIRFAFDSKTLNDEDSVGKNWQNMINDLATEATTVHSRFPHAVVAFVVAIPEPCLGESQKKAMTETLERLARRIGVRNDVHMAEAISLVLWNPANGSINPSFPHRSSTLRLEKFAEQVEAAYVARYKGLPPHAED